MPSFKAEKVLLVGANLIEASAGTGKTYSIAILVLRLVMKGIPINEILMVTFTNFAVSELEVRIRLFLRLAEMKSNGKDSGEATIDALVADEMAKDPEKAEDIRKWIRQAVLQLDETNIMTIHSFCQQALNEFAFETGQTFGAKAITGIDESRLLNDAVNRFWRTHIIGMDKYILEKLTEVKFKKKTLLDAVKLKLGGKLFNKEASQATEGANDEALVGIELVLARLKQHKQQIVKKFDDSKDQIVYDLSNHNESDSILNTHNIDFRHFQSEAVFDILCEKFKAGRPLFILEIFDDYRADFTAYNQLEKECAVLIHGLINKICANATEEISKTFQQGKKLQNWINFDDMITGLHDAVCSEGVANEELISALQKKYKAVFVDEFQDTDKLQYEIFEKLYGRDSGSGTLLFYIGDPKQSIYAFRKADVFTYLKAAENVDQERFHTMNTNYRSSALVLKALNHFFLPTSDFDTFHFGAQIQGQPSAARIDYKEVETPSNDKGSFCKGDKPLPPLVIQPATNEREVINHTIATIIDLLTDPSYTIPGKEGPRAIRPADIGILVRENKHAKKIKKALSRHRIPSVTIDETGILETDAARDMLYLLDAVSQIDIRSVKRALVSSLGGYPFSDLATLDESELLEQFRSYKLTWNEKGVYVMLMQFMVDHKVKSRLLDPATQSGDRKLSNFLQLGDLLHQQEVLMNFTPLELLQWLKISIDSGKGEGDQYQQRLESDEEAVKIVTIHKSKGLEYDIVMAPFLDFNIKEKFQFLSYRNPTDGKYYFVNNGSAGDAKNWYRKESEQENRRLLYVALTRAKFACFVAQNDRHKKSTLRHFYNSLKGTKDPKTKQSDLPAIDINGIIEQDAPPYNKKWIYPEGQTKESAEFSTPERFVLEQMFWEKLSFSFISQKHAAGHTFTGESSGDPYDRFVFNELKRGAVTGNMLHSIFEQIDFADDKTWQPVVDKVLFLYNVNERKAFSENILKMLKVVLGLQIQTTDGTSFSLNKISAEKRLTELEFDFPLGLFHTDQLQELKEQGIPIRVRDMGNLEGIMNGLIDLVFEYGGKYYILDWKSNFLGYRAENYAEEYLAEAMEENNYHLQYLIYTIAFCKYLKQRIPDFDYERDFGGVAYVFLRGVRPGQQTGLFFSKPKWDDVQKVRSVLLSDQHLHQASA